MFEVPTPRRRPRSYSPDRIRQVTDIPVVTLFVANKGNQEHSPSHRSLTLTSIIKDQVLVLQQRGITAGVLHIEDTRDSIESLFLDKKDCSAAEPTKSNEIINGNFSLLFALSASTSSLVME